MFNRKELTALEARIYQLELTSVSHGGLWKRLQTEPDYQQAKIGLRDAWQRTERLQKDTTDQTLRLEAQMAKYREVTNARIRELENTLTAFLLSEGLAAVQREEQVIPAHIEFVKVKKEK